MEDDIINDITHVYVILGHYGSGKTEFAVNLALSLEAGGRKVAIADLDIVNPYFRSREKEELFRSRGIDLIGSPPGCSDADIPAVSARVNILFEDESLTGVIDAGGDPVGAKVLRRFAPKIRSVPAEVLAVINFMRPRTGTPEACVSYIGDIEASCGLKVTGLVNNTHAMGETGIEELKYGAEKAEETSLLSGIPIKCHTVRRDLQGEAGGLISPIFPVDIYMRKPWEY